MTEAEGKALAAGVAEVARHYPMPIDPGMVAIGTLAVTAFTIYRGKLAAVNARKKGAKPASSETVTANTGHVIVPVQSWFSTGTDEAGRAN